MFVGFINFLLVIVLVAIRHKYYGGDELGTTPESVAATDGNIDGND